MLPKVIRQARRRRGRPLRPSDAELPPAARSSSPCSSSLGGGRRIGGRSPSRRSGGAGSGSRRRRRRAPCPSDAASANASATSLIGPAGTAAARSAADPLGGGARPQHGLEPRGQLVGVRHARAVGGEARVGGQLGQPERVAEAREQAVVADRDGDRAVGGRERLVGRDARMAVAAPVRHDAAEHPRRALVEQRHAARRPSARPRRGGPRPVRARSASAAWMPDHGEQPADEVDDGGARLQRRPVGLAGDAHQAAHRLREEVVAGQRARLLGGPEGGHRAGDEARVAPRAASRRRGPSAPSGPGRKDSISTSARRASRRASSTSPRVAEVERERALVAVQAEVVGARRRRGTAGPRRACRRRRRAARP